MSKNVQEAFNMICAGLNQLRDIYERGSVKEVQEVLHIVEVLNSTDYASSIRRARNE